VRRLRPARRTLLVLLLIAAAQAVGPAMARSRSPQGSSELRGTVAGKGGGAIAQAEIVIVDLGRLTRSAPDGSFAMNDVTTRWSRAAPGTLR
jgi:hypothetical protein